MCLKYVIFHSPSPFVLSPNLLKIQISVINLHPNPPTKTALFPYKQNLAPILKSGL